MNQTYWHLFAYFGSVTNAVANMAIAGVPDSILTRNTAGNFILPQEGRVRAAWVGSANAQRARINTPSFRYVGLPYLAPVNTGLTIPSPPNIVNYTEMGPRIPVADEISVEGTQGGGAAENMYAVIAASFTPKPTPGGASYRLRFTGAITASAGTWQNGSMTPDQTLPAGTYAVVGMDIQGANLVAARLIFAGGGWRPGCIARNALTSIAHPLFTSGEMGTFGEFDSVNLPNLEVMSTGANTAQEVYLDVVRVGNR